MPCYKNLDVRLVKRYKGCMEDLKEWGTHTDDGESTVLTYIQSDTDVSFHISIKPRVPWDNDLVSKNGLSQVQPSTHTPKKHSTKSRSLDVSTSNSSSHAEMSPVVKGQGFNQQQLPHRGEGQPGLLISVYFDGIRLAERIAIMHLDEKHPDFEENMLLTCRQAFGPDGQLYEQKWMFKDGGIERALKRLLLSESSHKKSSAATESDDDAVIRVLQSVHLKATSSKLKTPFTAGSIAIVFHSVSVGRGYHDATYRPKHELGDGADRAGGNDDLEHHVGLSESANVMDKEKLIVPYVHMSELPWATFSFIYRPEKTLRQMGFENFPAALNFNERTTPALIRRPPPLSISRKRQWHGAGPGNFSVYDSRPSKSRMIATSHTDEKIASAFEGHSGNGKGVFDSNPARGSRVICSTTLEHSAALEHSTHPDEEL
ncbi:MAG: hypothetical protein M1814_001921 [Vezdaea aestivalis]|nr:MAG: hypothetical protein M1814_001921 [Vezdaea aestivalis]